jgi:hypothetical protein
MYDIEPIEQIRQLKARYFRLMDTKDWAAFRELFTPDVRIDVTSDGAGVFEGLDSFLDMLLPALADVVTVHHGHMPELQITSPTTATGIWAMEDRLQFPEGGPIKEVHGWGHYHDTYVLSDGTWRIAPFTLTRLRVVVL